MYIEYRRKKSSQKRVDTRQHNLRTVIAFKNYPYVFLYRHVAYCKFVKEKGYFLKTHLLFHFTASPILSWKNFDTFKQFHRSRSPHTAVKTIAPVSYNIYFNFFV